MSAAPAAWLDPPEPQPVDLRLPPPNHVAQRAAQIGLAITRHLGPLAAQRATGRAVPARVAARGLRRVFQELGATFVKYGQIVASSPSLFGDTMAEEFRSCLDAGRRVPMAVLRRRLTSELGRPVDDLFDTIDREPLGRASLAVVHRATAHDGRDVAVKVLRPGIERLVATDLSLMRPLFEQLAHRLGEETTEPLLQMLDGLRQQLAEELDLRNEAGVMDWFRALAVEVELPLVVVPEPYHELSSRRVLTMELLDGVAVDDLASIEQLGVDPAPVVAQVVQAWFLTALRGGVFHGDVHAGNILVLRDGRIGVLDWGIVGRLQPETLHLFRRLIAGAALGDEAAWDDVARHFTAQWGAAARDRLGVDDATLFSFFRQQTEQVLTRPFGEVSLAQLLALPQQQVGRAPGGATATSALAGMREATRARRSERRRSGQEPVPLPAVDRGMLLLGKQLAYFERYGRLYLRDVPLLADRDFFATALAGTSGSPASERPRQPAGAARGRGEPKG